MRIVVIEAAALHLGFIGCYGNDWVATPNLDRLATESVVFDQHLADAPEPFSAAAWWRRSAVTGRYQFPDAPASVSMPDGAMHYATIPGLTDFAPRVLDAFGGAAAHAPIVWIDGPSLAPPWRLPEDLLTVYAEDDELPCAALADPAVGLGELSLDELDRLQAAYAAVLTFFDAQLGCILDDLRARGVLERLFLCVTASCGLPLDEHGMTGMHRAWLHEECVHIPLIARLPAAQHGGVRVPALTQPIDLGPTFADFLAAPAPPDGHGRSLWPLLRGEVDEVRPYAASGLRIGDSEEWLLRTLQRALLLPVHVPVGDPARGMQLYVKPDDRWEVNHLAQRYADEADGLAQTLRAFVEATCRPGPLVVPPLAVLEETT
jgi:arylsulfatase A-like enzyme